MAQQSANTSGNSTPPSKTFACANCGSPISVYPPDDIHKVASRERSSFLEAVEGIGVCSKCNEKTRFYWGKPVAYRAIVILARRIGQVLASLVLRIPLGRLPLRGTAKSSPDEAEASPQISDEEREDIENRLIDYISENGGAIMPNRAAEELGIPVELLNESIERMKVDGRLKQTAAVVAAEAAPSSI